MLTILCNGIDITYNVVKNSVSGIKQLQNRTDTASFNTFDVEVKEGDFIEIREGCVLREPFSSGGNVFEISDTFSISDKFRPGAKIYIDFDGINKKVAYVQSIDHLNRELTTTQNILNNYGVQTKIGTLKFAGIVQNAPETEMTRGSCEPVLERTVNVGDWRQLFDRKNVVDTYENMYFREILSRIIYKFCATDKELDLITFETVGTGTGIINTIALDYSDRIQGGSSLVFGTSGAGNGTMTYTISSTDITTYEKIRFFQKIKLNSGQYVNALKFRVGSGVNYFEWDIKTIGDTFDGARGLESVTLREPDNIVGSPSLSAITTIQRYIDVTDNLDSDAFHFDICQAFSGSFTCNNAQRGSVVYQDVRLQYKKPSVAIDSFAKKSMEYRHIDNERDVHYYNRNGGDEQAPFQIDDYSQNFGDMKIDIDITNMRNRQTIRGGQAPDEALYIQDESADGVATSRRLDYKPKDLRIFVSNSAGGGGGFTEYTVGVENLVNESSVDYVFNFNEKTIRKTDGVPVPLNHTFRREYYPYKDIRVRMQDSTSIAKMKALTGGDGIYDGPVISDPAIKTFQEARQRAKAELEAYKNPIVTITFKTNFDGLQPGQIISIKDTDRGIDDGYMIQKVQWSSRNDTYRTYSVTASTTLFGITEFLQLILKRSDRREIDVSEIVDIVQNIDEVLQIGDTWTFRKNSAPWYVHSRNLPYDHTLTLTEGGTTNDGYVGFCQLS